MKIIGTIEKVMPSITKEGVQRSFMGKDGKKYLVYNVIVVRRQDNGMADRFICESIRPEEEGEPYKDYIGEIAPLTLNIYFEVRIYEGKYFQLNRLMSVLQQVI